MPLRRVWIVALLVGMAVGCMTRQPVRSTSWLDRLRQMGGGPTGPDVVQLDVAVIERPIGDTYVDAELWEMVDEQVVSLERKAILDDNGFRMAHVSGITPAPLQALLTSDRSNPNPRRLRLHGGNVTKVLLGPPRPNSQFELRLDKTTQTVALTNAQFSLEVLPSLTDDGRTRLRFVPQIVHGQKSRLPQPAPDRSGWMWQEQRPTERYEQLSWEVDLAPNEYIVIGSRYDQPQSLAWECFHEVNDSVAVQRLLVIRTNRSLPELPPPVASPLEAEALPTRTPPLALQAATSVIRGNKE